MNGQLTNAKNFDSTILNDNCVDAIPMPALSWGPARLVELAILPWTVPGKQKKSIQTLRLRIPGCIPRLLAHFLGGPFWGYIEVPPESFPLRPAAESLGTLYLRR